MYYERPKNKEELQRREAIGTIHASRLVRKLAKSNQPIDVGSIYDIHKTIFKVAWPEIAGVLRTENTKITGSPHLPPHYSQVPGLMLELDKELKKRVASLTVLPMMNRLGPAWTKKERKMVMDIVGVAAWIHHKIVYIHPFVDGNGRTARLMTNLILERYRLIGISIKMERENKNEYRTALQQIDKEGDYKPLEDIIVAGLIDRYTGVKDSIV